MCLINKETTRHCTKIGPQEINTEFKTWAIWRGNPPDPYSMWSLKPYKGQECDGMRLVAVFGGTARSANRFFLAWTKE